jgi:hypothetical protein
LSEFDYVLNYREQSIEFEENGDLTNALTGARLPVERDRGRVLIRTKPSTTCVDLKPFLFLKALLAEMAFKASGFVFTLWYHSPEEVSEQG